MAEIAKECSYTSFYYSDLSGKVGKVPDAILSEYGIDYDSFDSIDDCLMAIKDFDFFCVVTETLTRWENLPRSH